MSIGITQRPIQHTPSNLDFSALDGSRPYSGHALGEQTTQQAVSPGALLFGSDKQKEINFGPPDNTLQPPGDKSRLGDNQSNLIQLLSALIIALLQMLMKSADKNPNQEQTEGQDSHQNNGLGTQLADSGNTDTTYDATSRDNGTGSDRDSDGVTPPATTPLANAKHNTAADTGTLSDPTRFPTASNGAKVVNETIKVGPGETFDGHNQTFTAGSKLGNGDQSEDQKPLFELAEGATLKNVILGDNEADGIHVRAANEKPVTVDNVHWTDVGEDALTVKPEGGADVTNLNITNSSAKGANDKIFQLNANAHVKLDNFQASDFGTLMRTNGGKQFDKMELELNNVQAEHGKFAFVKSDSENLKLTTSNIRLTDVQHHYDKTKASTQHTER
ncbi:pectate lyase [Pseudomonas sp. Z1-12]|uniref:pectate lyase n=1 Tax=Pseudomonas sp. Z1-12 TaxID=2817408 RepID=UPI003DA7BD96